MDKVNGKLREEQRWEGMKSDMDGKDVFLKRALVTLSEIEAWSHEGSQGLLALDTSSEGLTRSIYSLILARGMRLFIRHTCRFPGTGYAMDVLIYLPLSARAEPERRLEFTITNV